MALKKIPTRTQVNVMAEKETPLESQAIAEVEKEMASTGSKVLGNATIMATEANVVTDQKPTETQLEAAEKKKYNFERFMSPANAKVIEELMANQNIDWSKVDERYLLDDAIVAIDMQLPSYLDIKLKDPVYMGRWVNRKFNGEGGNRYEQMKAMGFVNVEPEDCLGGFDANRINVQDGGIMCGDVIFMKISKPLLLGYYKRNYIKANRMFSSKNVHKEAKNAAQKEFVTAANGAGISAAAYKDKIGFFSPGTIPTLGSLGEDE